MTEPRKVGGKKRGRPRDAAKSRAILSAASELFLAQGLQQTSMDAIAGRAGVSKQTLYTHFRSKDDLFRAVIRTKVAEHQIEASPDTRDGEAVEAMLQRLGTELLSLISDPQVVAMFRVVIGEAHAHPRIAQLFYEAGPAQALTVMAAQLETHMRAGALGPGDPRTAARVFSSLLKGELHLQLLLGLPAEDLRAAIDGQVREAVQTFLAAWGREPAGA